VADPRPSSTRILARLLGYARPYLAFVALTVVFSLAYAGGLTWRVSLIRPLLDDVAVPSLNLRSLEETLGQAAAVDPEQQARDRHELSERIERTWHHILLAAVVLVLGMPLVHWVRDYTGEWVMTRMLADMQSALGTSFLQRPLARHVSESRGDAVSRTLWDTLLANRAQSLVFGEAIQDVAIVVVSLVGMFVVNWQLGVVMIAVGPPIALVLSVSGRRIRRASLQRQEQMSEVTQRLMRILSGIKVIRAFGGEGLEARAFTTEALRLFRRAMRVTRQRVMSRSLVELLSQAGFVSLLLVGVWAVIGNLWSLTVGALAAFLGLSAMLYRPMKNLVRLYTAVQDALPAAERMFEVLDERGEPADAADAVSVDRMRSGLAFRDVWFSYGREPVLCGVDLEIAAGEVVALVGRTGAGKTTLVDLIPRFYDPERGRVELDGIDLRRIRRASLRERIAVVTQDAFLFDTTIAENIRYGRPDASFEEVVEAARAAHAHEFIDRLPEGYETEVGEIGNRLSGGQRQRITIARALLRNPDVLVFDEATSALDATSERLVQDAMGALMKGRTVVLIAHRLSTLRIAHRIAVLDGGRIALTGTHDELYRGNALYRELADLQLLEASTEA
jgi:subfamily B ATP-binding cassette protein MsbA